MEPYAFGYGVGLASKSDVSSNTPKADEAKPIISLTAVIISTSTYYGQCKNKKILYNFSSPGNYTLAFYCSAIKHDLISIFIWILLKLTFAV